MSGISTVAALAVAMAGVIVPPTQPTTFATTPSLFPADASVFSSDALPNSSRLAVTKRYNETAVVQEFASAISLDELFERANVPSGSGYRVIQTSLDFLKEEGCFVHAMLNELIYDPDEDLNNLVLTFLIDVEPEEAFDLGNRLTRRIIRGQIAHASNLVVMLDSFGAVV